MKLKILVVSMALMGTQVFANHPIDTRLSFVSNSLVFATQQLVNALRSCRGDNHIVQDAQTLQFASEHFNQEVVLGPVDLDVDFQRITETFVEMRMELTNSLEIRYNREARAAWFNTEEAFISLRQAWLVHCGGDGNSGGGNVGGGHGGGNGGGGHGGGNGGGGHGGGNGGGGHGGGGYNPYPRPNPRPYPRPGMPGGGYPGGGFPGGGYPRPGPH